MLTLVHIIVSAGTPGPYHLFTAPNHLDTDISGNNIIEDTYSVVWKLETQLVIKPRIIIQEESGEKINEQRREYLVQG